MKINHCVNGEGEHFTIFQNAEGYYCCPICGSPEFKESPYDENGLPLFEICSCGFQFGYDDTPSASKNAVKGIIANWDRWRLKVIEESATSKVKLETLEKNLNNLGIKLAFDLIPVKKNLNI